MKNAASAARYLALLADSAAFETGVVAAAGFVGHHQRGLQAHAGERERMRDRLVRADGVVEHDPVLGVGDRTVQGDFTDPDRFVREEDTFGVEAVQELLEAFAFVADEAPLGNREAVVGDFARRGPCCGRAWGWRGCRRSRGRGPREEQAQPAQPGRRVRIRARDQQDHFGLECLGGPDLAARDLPAALAVRLRAAS